MWRNIEISGVEYSYTEGGGVLHWSAIIAAGPFHIQRHAIKYSQILLYSFKSCQLQQINLLSLLLVVIVCFEIIIFPFILYIYIHVLFFRSLILKIKEAK